MPVRIGVAGIGVHGLHHVRLLSSMDGVVFAGIYDINPDVCVQAATEFQTTPFETLEALLEQVDCLAVAVPTTVHCDVVMNCLSRGKSVLVEKPIASSLEEAELLISEADKRKLVLSVGHLERFNSAYRSVSSTDSIAPGFIESHRLSVFNPRGTDVAVVLDLMIHDIDIVLDMVKKPVRSVHAVGIPVVTEEVDIANARLEFEGGCVANLTASRISTRKMRKVRAFKKNAYISMDFLTGESEVYQLPDGTRPSGTAGSIPQVMKGISYKKFPNDGLNALELELADFIGAVRENGSPRVTGRDGRNALEIASMIMEKIEVKSESVNE